MAIPRGMEEPTLNSDSERECHKIDTPLPCLPYCNILLSQLLIGLGTAMANKIKQEWREEGSSDFLCAPLSFSGAIPLWFGLSAFLWLFTARCISCLI